MLSQSHQSNVFNHGVDKKADTSVENNGTNNEVSTNTATQADGDDCNCYLCTKGNDNAVSKDNTNANKGVEPNVESKCAFCGNASCIYNKKG